jgi:hypothetical protein
VQAQSRDGTYNTRALLAPLDVSAGAIGTSAALLVGAQGTANAVDLTLIAQSNNPTGAGDLDVGQGSVQGYGPDGKTVYVAQIVMRIADGSGATRYFANGKALPANIQTLPKAQVFVRQQIRLGRLGPLPRGDQGAFATTVPASNGRGGAKKVGDRLSDRVFENPMSANTSQLTAVGRFTLNYNRESVPIELIKREEPQSAVSYFVRERDASGGPSKTLIYLGDSPAGDSTTARRAAENRLQSLLDLGLIPPARVGLKNSIAAADTRGRADDALAAHLVETTQRFDKLPAGKQAAQLPSFRRSLTTALEQNHTGTSDALKAACQGAYASLSQYVQRQGFANLDSKTPDPAGATVASDALLRLGATHRLDLSGSAAGAERLKTAANAVSALPRGTARARMDHIVNRGMGQAISQGLGDLVSVGSLTGPLAVAALKPLVVKFLAKKWGTKLVLARVNGVLSAVGYGLLAKDAADVSSSLLKLNGYYAKAGAKGLKSEEATLLAEGILEEGRASARIVGQDALFGAIQAAPAVNRRLNRGSEPNKPIKPTKQQTVQTNTPPAGLRRIVKPLNPVTRALQMRNFGNNSRAISNAKRYSDYIDLLDGQKVSTVVRIGVSSTAYTGKSLIARTRFYRDTGMRNLSAESLRPINVEHHDVHTSLGSTSKLGEVNANSGAFSLASKESWAERGLLPGQGGRAIAKFWRPDVTQEWLVADDALKALESAHVDISAAHFAKTVTGPLSSCGFLPKGSPLATRLERLEGMLKARETLQTSMQTAEGSQMAALQGKVRAVNTKIDAAIKSATGQSTQMRTEVLQESLGSEATTYELTVRHAAAARYLQSVEGQPDAVFNAARFKEILAAVKAEAGPAEAIGKLWHRELLQVYGADKGFVRAMNQSVPMQQAWAAYKQRFGL